MIDVRLEEALEKIAYGRSALVPVADLPRVLDVDNVEALRTIVRLRRDGLLDLWDLPTRDEVVLVATLTTRSASALGVELEASDRKDLRLARWVPRGRSRPPKVVSTKRVGRLTFFEGDSALEDQDGVGIADVPDHRTADPSVAAELAELATLPGYSKFHRRPGVIVGAAAVWPPHAEADGSCPGCRERWTAPSTFCVACGRTSVDPNATTARFDAPAVPRRMASTVPMRPRPKRPVSPLLDPKPRLRVAGYTTAPSRSARPRPRPLPRPQSGR